MALAAGHAQAEDWARYIAEAEAAAATGDLDAAASSAALAVEAAQSPAEAFNAHRLLAEILFAQGRAHEAAVQAEDAHAVIQANDPASLDAHYYILELLRDIHSAAGDDGAVRTAEARMTHLRAYAAFMALPDSGASCPAHGRTAGLMHTGGVSELGALTMAVMAAGLWRDESGFPFTLPRNACAPRQAVMDSGRLRIIENRPDMHYAMVAADMDNPDAPVLMIRRSRMLGNLLNIGIREGTQNPAIGARFHNGRLEILSLWRATPSRTQVSDWLAQGATAPALIAIGPSETGADTIFLNPETEGGEETGVEFGVVLEMETGLETEVEVGIETSVEAGEGG
ncbi:MAG: hypothetical protein KIS81_04125 [Maricaulaceae bacterium]|nr:hypothetical protein [Maricaulaceae bacterium]